MYYRDRRKGGDAVRYYEKSLETSLELGETVLIGIASLNIALAKSHLNDLEGAKGYCGQAFEIFRKLDDKLGIAESHLCLGIINRHKKRYAMARNSIGKSIQLNRRIQNNLGLAEAFREMALLYWDQGKSKQVLKYLGKSFRVFRELKATRYVADIDKQIRDLEEIYFRIAREMGEEVESKDTYTFGHCQRVARYAVRLAEELDLSENEIKAILVAAFLHDLGKVKIPKEILIKPKKLTPDEYLAVTYHPAWGVEMLESVEFPWEVKSLILHHQERYDGQGYPEGLAGKKIPLGARIIAIADFFDALTTDRPYRKAMSLEETFALMVREREKILDPQLLDVFLSLVRKRFPPGKSLLGQMVCQGLSESASTGQMKSPAPRRKVPA
ncbi:MAG: hypothetical protein A2Z06_00910 [Candidatus Glassbacteria bacterium RBG_16_58_8]|uniref:Uncharacterized protein n=1 Tax=Candidatus Glassbacteria bacterium RBG_16_58_8 TaxID=1817866 RepID=A0A1F5YD39_9BACT|nr:MAG: hypothetical protein A2Z06_00910 [Candidatus Glassbacteria bacterium RBG_16_58_8]